MMYESSSRTLNIFMFFVKHLKKDKIKKFQFVWAVDVYHISYSMIYINCSNELRLFEFIFFKMFYKNQKYISSTGRGPIILNQAKISV